MIMQTQETPMGHISHSIAASQSKMQASSSRILYDTPCKVCRDHSSGKHYGIFACDGCAGFFKRSIRKHRQYVCKAKSEGGCMVDKTHRNQCRACRLAKCVQAGMNKDAVQHERGPRNSTLRRQMQAHIMYSYNKEPEMMSSMAPPPGAVLDLAMPKAPVEPRVSVASSQAIHPLPPPTYCSSVAMTKIPATIGCMPTIPFLPLMASEPVCEYAARLLFFSIYYARDLAAGTGLVLEDQLILLEASWKELFLLTVAQMLPSLDPSSLLPPPGSLGVGPLASEVRRFRDTIAGFRAMNLDAHEYACIKAIVFFRAGLENDQPVPSSRSSSGSMSPNFGGRLRDPMAVARLKDEAQQSLGQRLSGSPLGAQRFGSLLLVLIPSLKHVSSHAIEELFFKRQLGGAPLETIIGNIYKNEQLKT